MLRGCPVITSYNEGKEGLAKSEFQGQRGGGISQKVIFDNLLLHFSWLHDLFITLPQSNPPINSLHCTQNSLRCFVSLLTVQFDCIGVHCSELTEVVWWTSHPLHRTFEKSGVQIKFGHSGPAKFFQVTRNRQNSCPRETHPYNFIYYGTSFQFPFEQWWNNLF